MKARTIVGSSGVYRYGIAALVLAVWGVVVGSASPAGAQVPSQVIGGTMQGPRRTVPTDAYFLVLGEYYAGNYTVALRDFQSCLSSAVKTSSSFWIDSICYHTMCGECLYQMGRNEAALDQYNKALNLQIAFNDWMIPVKFNAVITPSQQASTRAIPWGQSQRQMVIGSFPDSVLIQQGQVDQSQKLASGGGVIQQAQQLPINPQEIVRCVCLSLRRRREILGPLAPYDALTGQLIAVLTKRPVQPNHWSEAWVDVMLGCAFASLGKDVQAKPLLDKSILAAGQYDHPMSSVALYESGRLALNAGDNDLATKFLQEASYSGFYFFDPLIVEDSLRLAATTHILANRGGGYAPLVNAANYARQQGFRQMYASLMVMIAENQCLLDQPAAANTTLDNVRANMQRSDMGKGRVGSQLNYTQAQVNYQLGNASAGDVALNAALAFSRVSSLSLFRMALTERLVAVDRTLPTRHASEVFAELLRDPTPNQWLHDPLDAMAVLVFPHPIYFERWLEVSLDRKELDGKRALEIADLAKRHKYLSTLEMGGRLLALRWILEGPTESLSKLAGLQRQAYLTQFPKYEQLSQQARAIRGELGQLPIVAGDPPAVKLQMSKMAEFDKTTRELEMMLKFMALRRMPSEIVFPPIRTAEETQKALPNNHALLTFYAGARNTYGFLMTNDKFGYWPIASTAEVNKRLIAVLQGLGNFNENKVLNRSDLENTAWHRPSQELFELLTKDSKAELPYGFNELVIIPDSVLWYVPFETLYVSPQGKAPKPLLELVRIRYAPTMGLATGDVRSRLDKGKTLVSLGKLYPGDDDSIAETAFAELARAVPQAESFRVKTKLLVSPTLLAGMADRLITFADIVPSPNGPLGNAPLTGDKNSVNGTLGDWLRLPWHGPEQVALPGFHSAAEDVNNFKKGLALDAGNELYLTVMNLMASGARTVLISRWRPGGRTSYDLVREFMQELPYESATKSWQRAVALSMQTPIALDAEPRIRLEGTDAPPEARHPFFWAAYMVVDTGTEPAVAASDAAKQALNPVPNNPVPNNPAPNKPNAPAPAIP